MMPSPIPPSALGRAAAFRTPRPDSLLAALLAALLASCGAPSRPPVESRVASRSEVVAFEIDDHGEYVVECRDGRVQSVSAQHFAEDRVCQSPRPVVSTFQVPLACPEGSVSRFVSEARGGFYCSRSGIVVGPFPAEQRRACESLQAPEACAKDEWSELVYLQTHGGNSCAPGLRFDDELAVCVTGSLAQGPFPERLAHSCDDTAACAGTRWSIPVLESAWRSHARRLGSRVVVFHPDAKGVAMRKAPNALESTLTDGALLLNGSSVLVLEVRGAFLKVRTTDRKPGVSSPVSVEGYIEQWYARADVGPTANDHKELARGHSTCLATVPVGASSGFLDDEVTFLRFAPLASSDFSSRAAMAHTTLTAQILRGGGVADKPGPLTRVAGTLELMPRWTSPFQLEWEGAMKDLRKRNIDGVAVNVVRWRRVHLRRVFDAAGAFTDVLEVDVEGQAFPMGVRLDCSNRTRVEN